MDTAELGRQLRARRTAAGRTVASVAAEAGLSVPYVANLENGRGNPTVAALQAWASALGLRLDVTLRAVDAPVEEVPAAVRRFGRSARFLAETQSLGEAAGSDPTELRRRLLRTMAALLETSPHEPTELDLQRVLDAVVLTHRGTTWK
ncbi:helix-turn-helix domain-containing protein [Tenggerimyces flavus]|uniref:Helix-turn-helix domain-containing protein n=1 Tax=Tenggerimyces flavus TaxID=1708749 RepID=A0ABV7YG26_9ACTN|nr:helix-turn-helix transcriptional regulator [Tenggerimyces flavus]MBM7784331.1 transcriptional regulator with XRE-family HTH domain [Tenggerimyces flavus]